MRVAPVRMRDAARATAALERTVVTRYGADVTAGVPSASRPVTVNAVRVPVGEREEGRGRARLVREHPALAAVLGDGQAEGRDAVPVPDEADRRRRARRPCESDQRHTGRARDGRGDVEHAVAPLVGVQAPSPVAVSLRIVATSSAEREGFAAHTSAAAPETCGAAKERAAREPVAAAAGARQGDRLQHRAGAGRRKRAEQVHAGRDEREVRAEAREGGRAAAHGRGADCETDPADAVRVHAAGGAPPGTGPGCRSARRFRRLRPAAPRGSRRTRPRSARSWRWRSRRS